MTEAKDEPGPSQNTGLPALELRTPEQGETLTGVISHAQTPCQAELMSLCYSGRTGAVSRQLLRTARPPAPPGASALDRVKAFLPSMAAAQEQLAQRQQQGEAQRLDIEVLDPAGSQHIELNLSCGLFNLHDTAAQAAAKHATCSSGETAPQRQRKRTRLM